MQIPWYEGDLEVLPDTMRLSRELYRGLVLIRYEAPDVPRI